MRLGKLRLDKVKSLVRSLRAGRAKLVSLGRASIHMPAHGTS